MLSGLSTQRRNALVSASISARAQLFAHILRGLDKLKLSNGESESHSRAVTFVREVRVQSRALC